MPLTDDGWVTISADDALKQAKSEIQKNLGIDTDVSDGSAMGRIAQMLANRIVECDNVAQNVYDNNFWLTASGVSMDRLGTSLGIQRHQAQYAEATLNITGTSGYLIPAQTEFITDKGDSFLSDDDVQIDQNGNATVVVHSQEASASTNVDAHTIINQANPVDEIESVDNPMQASGGSDLESDYDFRNRGTINQYSPENPTVGGIRTALINVNGVSSVTIQNNQSKSTDEHGNPANTIHIYVVGGTDDDIANKLADVLAGGATTVGSITKHVNVYGNDIVVNFDRAQQKTLSFKIDITTGDGFDEDAVKQSVQDYLSNFEMGDKVILNKLYPYLYQLIGIKQVNSIQVSTDGSSYNSNDLQLANFEFALTRNDDVEVITHG
ncbi:hypothetical protein AKUH4B410M_08910 [Apilactobacillus kunkeei]|nr:hypothetical protein AKUH4B405J_08910 [Apilactobacillus kunkeei]CAI2612413.1 hypothetical protein AKUH4B102A_08950 [Apilactobacillus kunkeei]CAI2614300.1 hypothetical protein AKUH4B410M_08910 [Apilactobacillus kunkeei]CAI2616190.1 hypothetical protein AKUH4B210M_09050 [Apilactobacillus kunkeei]CAI2682450.1 hypothetical protein AKUH3B102X_08900 [Apilactobacillus kunkeei]